MIAVGFGLTLLVFYPGVMTYDAQFVYQDIAKGFRGDWQSPVMIVLWALIDPIAPGAGSMFLLIVTFYWLAFGLLAFTVARRSIWLAVVLLLLALSPPAFVFVGIIWRDVLFASTWLLAAALAFAVAEREAKLRVPIQALALGLLAFGVLLRPNALIAAPILGAYIVWPAQFSWKRAAIILCAGRARAFCAGAGRLLRRARRDAAASAALDHGVRPRRHQPLCPSRTSFPVTWTVSETCAAHHRLLSADRVGHLLARSSPANS